LDHAHLAASLERLLAKDAMSLLAATPTQKSSRSGARE